MLPRAKKVLCPTTHQRTCNHTPPTHQHTNTPTRLDVAQAIPGDYTVGEVVYSLLAYEDEDGSYSPGTKGTIIGQADDAADRGACVKVEFESYAGAAFDTRVSGISRDPDPNSVSARAANEYRYACLLPRCRLVGVNPVNTH